MEKERACCWDRAVDGSGAKQGSGESNINTFPGVVSSLLKSVFAHQDKYHP